MLPGVAWKSGLEARLAEKLFRGPSPLDRHLRQEQPAPESLLRDEAVAADRNGRLIPRINFFERAKDRDFDRQFRQFIGGDGGKPRVLAGRIGRAPSDLGGETAAALQRAKTPAQFSTTLDGDENARRVRQRDVEGRRIR